MFILSIILIILSLLFRLEKNKENKIINQIILEEQRTLQRAWEAEEKNYLMGKFNPENKNNFAPIPDIYSISGYKMYLRKETLDAFLQMRTKAQKDGVDLLIASATRNFDYQKNLWNNKWTGITLVNGKNLLKNTPSELERFEKILEYSAVPGTSRHHWGTDIDINAAIPEYFNTEKGEAVYAWLVKNASSFGFCQPYNLKNTKRTTGYNEEKWHWSYSPLSKVFTQEYKNLITKEDISSFDGDEYGEKIDLINDYVLSVNKDCF